MIDLSYSLKMKLSPTKDDVIIPHSVWQSHVKQLKKVSSVMYVKIVS